MLIPALGAVAALAAVALTAAGIGWPALVIGLAALALAFPDKFGWLRRLALAGLTYIGYALTVGTAFSILGRELSPPLFIGLFAVLSVGTAVLATRRTPRPLRASGRSGDVVIAVTGLLLAAVFLHWGIGKDAAGLVSQLSVGGDNANHFNLIRSIQQGRSFQYASSPVPGLLGGMEAYPQGFAFLVGYTGWLFTDLGQIPTVAETVWTSWALLALQPVVAVLAVLLIVRGLLLGVSKPPAGANARLRLATPMIAAAVVVSPVLLLTLYVHLWSFGFQTQMFAINAVLFALWLTVDPAFTKNSAAARSLVLLGVSVTVMAIAGSWYLLAPPAVALAVVVAWPMVRALRQIPWWIWPATVIAAIVALYPLTRGTPDSAGQLVMTGGVRIFSPVTGLALVVLAAIVMFSRRRPGWYLEPLPVSFAVSVVLALGVGAFQLLQTGEFSYYFFKTLYLPATLAVVPVGWGAARLVGRSFRGDRRVVTGVVGVAALALALVIFNESKVLFLVADGPVDEAVIAQVLDDYPNGLPADRDVVAAAYCDWKTSGQTTSWIGGLFTSWTTPRQQFYLAVDRGAEKPADLFAYGNANVERQIEVRAKSQCSLHADFMSGIPSNMKLISE